MAETTTPSHEAPPPAPAFKVDVQKHTADHPIAAKFRAVKEGVLHPGKTLKEASERRRALRGEPMKFSVADRKAIASHLKEIKAEDGSSGLAMNITEDDD